MIKVICNCFSVLFKFKVRCYTDSCHHVCFFLCVSFYHVDTLSKAGIRQYSPARFSPFPHSNRICKLDIINSSFCPCHVLPSLHLLASIQAYYPRALLSQLACLLSSTPPPCSLFCSFPSLHSRLGTGQ